MTSSEATSATTSNRSNCSKTNHFTRSRTDGRVMEPSCFEFIAPPGCDDSAAKTPCVVSWPSSALESRLERVDGYCISTCDAVRDRTLPYEGDARLAHRVTRCEKSVFCIAVTGIHSGDLTR